MTPHTRRMRTILAVVHGDILSQLQGLQEISTAYERVSGLKLNVKKTVLVPLFPFESLSLRARIHAAAPLWGHIGLAKHAKYLGVYLGLDCRTPTWAAPLAKFMDRIKHWAAAGLGMHNTIDAYRGFIASVLMYVAE